MIDFPTMFQSCWTSPKTPVYLHSRMFACLQTLHFSILILTFPIVFTRVPVMYSVCLGRVSGNMPSVSGFARRPEVHTSHESIQLHLYQACPIVTKYRPTQQGQFGKAFPDESLGPATPQASSGSSAGRRDVATHDCTGKAELCLAPERAERDPLETA